ncbi:MAG: phosphate ABC transporter permease subunit PstC [Solirubrobacteraceae bacterium]
MQASTFTARGDRPSLERSPASRLPDRALKWGLSGLAAAILILIAFFFIRLIGQSNQALSQFGFSFVFRNNWDVARNIYEGASLVVGTLITSAIALVIGVPVAVATALYLTELCPLRARAPLGMLVDLLAAVPSVVYGLWGVWVLGPKLVPIEKWIANTFSFIPWIGGGAAAITPGNIFVAGLILAIMILPIVSAISREVLRTVPLEHKEAALALGATRWEMIRMSILPYSRSGITGGAMLGLGRAIGETIAVVVLIGDAPVIPKHLFSQGYSLAAVIANEFGESTGLHRSALFAAGLVLFVLTLVVNIVARVFVARSARGSRIVADAGTDDVVVQIAEGMP